MQTAMNKISFTDIKIQYSGEVIANQFIASRDLKVKFNLELFFIICNGYNVRFIIFS